MRICARPGDSGGPLFTEADGKALGILSNGDPGQGACTNPNERNSYAPISTILERVNARSGGKLRVRLATSGPAAGPVGPLTGGPTGTSRSAHQRSTGTPRRSLPPRRPTSGTNSRGAPVNRGPAVGPCLRSAG